jgi:hypothetical protein
MSAFLIPAFHGIPAQRVDYIGTVQKRLDMLGRCLLCDERFRFGANVRTDHEADDAESTTICGTCMEKLDRYLSGQEPAA